MRKLQLELSDDDLRKIFRLFSSPTDEELIQIFDPSSRRFYGLEDLGEEYNLTQEKREFSIDAWRAVTYFLHHKGFALVKDGSEYNLGTLSGYSAETGDRNV
jgi:hypothetical protein